MYNIWSSGGDLEHHQPHRHCQPHTRLQKEDKRGRGVPNPGEAKSVLFFIAVPQVSVQNLVEEMIDIVEEDEDKEMMCEDILEELLCDYFGVDPPTESEKIVRNLMGDIVDEAVETAENLNKGRRRGGVILDSKGRLAKKHFSIFDEVPEDLIEKRRSTRKVLTGTQPSLATSADSSQEVISRSGNKS